MLRHRFLPYTFVFLAVCLACVNPISAFGQVSASLSGRISDQTGVPIPGATVTAMNMETGVSRTVVSNPSGRYQFDGAADRTV